MVRIIRLGGDLQDIANVPTEEHYPRQRVILVSNRLVTSVEDYYSRTYDVAELSGVCLHLEILSLDGTSPTLTLQTQWSLDRHTWHDLEGPCSYESAGSYDVERRLLARFFRIKLTLSGTSPSGVYRMEATWRGESEYSTALATLLLQWGGELNPETTVGYSLTDGPVPGMAIEVTHEVFDSSPSLVLTDEGSGFLDANGAFSGSLDIPAGVSAGHIDTTARFPTGEVQRTFTSVVT